jgi:hypothetical protein
MSGIFTWILFQACNIQGLISYVFFHQMNTLVVLSSNEYSSSTFIKDSKNP